MFIAEFPDMGVEAFEDMQEKFYSGIFDEKLAEAFEQEKPISEVGVIFEKLSQLKDSKLESLQEQIEVSSNFN